MKKSIHSLFLSVVFGSLLVPDTAVSGVGNGDGQARPQGSAPYIGADEFSQSDLELEKTASVSATLVNTEITYTIFVNNLGPGTAANVVVQDLLPQGVTFVSDDAGCNVDNNDVNCDLGSLGNGESATINIIASLVETGTIENTAFVTTDSLDENASNDESSVSVESLPLVTPTPEDDPLQVAQGLVEQLEDFFRIARKRLANNPNANASRKKKQRFKRKRKNIKQSRRDFRDILDTLLDLLNDSEAQINAAFGSLTQENIDEIGKRSRGAFSKRAKAKVAKRKARKVARLLSELLQ